MGLASLALSVWSGRLAVRAGRWQDTGTREVADRLAVEVLAAERAAWRQLLGGSDRAIDVPFVHHPAPAHDAAGAAPYGRLEEVADYYRRLRPGRLVITGAPGAGKTVLALRIMLLLVEQRSAGDPVPVRLSPASWDPGMPLEEFVAHHLVETYRLTRAAADALVKDRRVLPVLDGLDEMDADPEPGYGSRAARALEALNAYHQGVRKAQLIVTCRSGPYSALEALRVWAHDAARVEITPLDAVTVRRFLADRVNDPARWRNVLDRLAADPTGPLATGLATPWRLTLAAGVHEQRHPGGAFARHPDTLLAPAVDTPDAVRDHLLDLFVPAATAACPPPSGADWTPDQIRAWLSVLARYLDGDGATGRSLAGRALPGTDIVLHELWPLAGRRGRAVSAVVPVVVWLAGCAVPLSLAPLDTRSRLVGLVVATALAVLLSCASWRALWPEPGRMYLRRRNASAERRNLGPGIASGVLTGLAFGTAFGLGFGPVIGLASGLTLGAAVGLVVSLGTSGAVGAVRPRDILRNDLLAGAAVTVAAGLAFGLVVTLVVGRPSGFAFGSAFGFAFAFGTGMPGGLVGLRYAGFLTGTRKGSGRWLPWRLGRFLDWCEEAGLVRIAGVGYQFRHRELQDHLTGHRAAASHPSRDDAPA
ncbi:NACHT domain-containing protein [Streptomyces specialis]|uniref:NACHT domain-containing protein n=1 Tax=Streptomyces specialis TaxID=498367 RepID=UPI00131AC27F|nr:NACHT domain-containing protein [Streptomyces specialis]